MKIRPTDVDFTGASAGWQMTYNGTKVLWTAPVAPGISDAPSNANIYARQTGAWLNISTLFAALAPLATPALTGTPTAPTAAAGTNTTQIATTAYSTAAILVETNRATTAEGLLAPKANPTFTGTVTIPTPSVGDNTTKAASTAFVTAAITVETNRATTAEGLLAPKANPAFTGTMTGVNQTLSGTFSCGGAFTASSGSVNIGSATGTVAGINFYAAAGNVRQFNFLSGANSRWAFGSDGTAESGSNVGSDFFYNSYTDAGAYLQTPFQMKRSTGLVTINYGLTLNGTLTLNTGAVGTVNGNVPGITSIGDVSYTVSLTGTFQTIYQTGALTATRAIALPAAGIGGQRYRIVRSGAGAFNLNITNSTGATTYKAMTTAFTWVDFEWSVASAVWIETAFGSL